MQWEVFENGLYLNFRVDEAGILRFEHFSSNPLNPEDFHKIRDYFTLEEKPDGFLLNELSVSGLDRPQDRHGNKYIGCAPGYRMTYVNHTDTRNETGRLLTFETADDGPDATGLHVITSMQFYDGLPVVRIRTRVENRGDAPQTLEHISSFNYLGIDKEGIGGQDEKILVHIPYNGWCKEMDWQTRTLPELGMAQTQPDGRLTTSRMITMTNTGNWSSKQYLPMGMIENIWAGTTKADMSPEGLYQGSMGLNGFPKTGNTLFWQIEHDGSWHWEIADQNGHLYLQLCGPTELYGHWWRTLAPGESFEAVPVAVGVTAGGVSEALAALTGYRRRIIRSCRDNEELPVIFNDYMNCLFGDPTTEKELPMIEAAARAGCEYYVIDAGWYADGSWWDSVGEWEESRERFPGGLKELTKAIRDAGMVPGLWLEPEVMGINCPAAKDYPDEAFFMRHGKRVYDRSRYQLDYRHPKVRAHMSEVVRRLVEDYGVGYFKMDYNIEPGIGTEVNAESPGGGMLSHEQAYLSWLDEILARYPDLVIESCSSGGQRIDYALLSRCALQSTSDQTDYAMYGVISANAAAGVLPEQAAVWCYPKTDDNREAVIYNIINAILLRIHQSGHLVNLAPGAFKLVQQGIALYKKIRKDIRTGTPFWPLGLADYSVDTMAYGIRCAGGDGEGTKMYLAVWQRKGTYNAVEIPIPVGDQVIASARCIFPEGEWTTIGLDRVSQSLTVGFDNPPPTARLFEILLKDETPEERAAREAMARNPELAAEGNMYAGMSADGMMPGGAAVTGPDGIVFTRESLRASMDEIPERWYPGIET